MDRILSQEDIDKIIDKILDVSKMTPPEDEIPEDVVKEYFKGIVAVVETLLIKSTGLDNATLLTIEEIEEKLEWTSGLISESTLLFIRSKLGEVSELQRAKGTGSPEVETARKQALEDIGQQIKDELKNKENESNMSGEVALNKGLIQVTPLEKAHDLKKTIYKDSIKILKSVKIGEMKGHFIEIIPKEYVKDILTEEAEEHARKAGAIVLSSKDSSKIDPEVLKDRDALIKEVIKFKDHLESNLFKDDSGLDGLRSNALELLNKLKNMKFFYNFFPLMDGASNAGEYIKARFEEPLKKSLSIPESDYTNKVVEFLSAWKSPVKSTISHMTKTYLKVITEYFIYLNSILSATEKTK